MGEENHDLCCAFFQILSNLLPDPPHRLHLTICYFTSLVTW